ncbi:MAG: dipeptidase [Fibrobacterales bacterium]
MIRKIIYLILAIPLAIIIGYYFVNGPDIVEANYNQLIKPPPYVYSDSARKLSDRLFIADLHNDHFMFNRSILDESDIGHTDVPRLLEGKVSLQTFSAATMLLSSWMSDPYSDSDGFDLFIPLSISQFYPPNAWFSPLNRALHIRNRLYKASRESNGVLRVIDSKSDLQKFVNQNHSGVISGILSIEGLHVLEGKIENVKYLYDIGYRMFGIAHFHDNLIGGSCSGKHQNGLTALGFEVVKEMDERGIIIDLAHASRKVYSDVLKVTRNPVVVSHTGVQGINPIERNMTDNEIKLVARTNGVIGVGFWDAAIKDASVVGIVNTIDYIKNLVGVDFVGLGSDYDGSIRAPFDARGIPMIVDELIRRNYSEDEIYKIMGGNILRVYLEVLK